MFQFSRIKTYNPDHTCSRAVSYATLHWGISILISVGGIFVEFLLEIRRKFCELDQLNVSRAVIDLNTSLLVILPTFA